MTMLALFAAAAGGAPPAYIEDVFSTWLYTGTGATQTITNGIDLSGKGGLTWIKSRSYSEDHCLFDTARGALNVLYSDTTDGSNSLANSLTAFTSTGFTLGSRDKVNTSAATYVSWTFREQPKFFDIVTWTGNGAGSRSINHNLQSAPGCIIMKALSSTGDWFVWHIGNGGGVGSASPNIFGLNNTNAAQYINSYGTMGDSTIFYPTSPGADFNLNGVTYVAYLFANAAGGFGVNGTDDVIKCGSYTANTASGVTVTLGWEPQWLLVKNAGIGNGGWVLMDNMRQSLTVNATSNSDLYANSSLSETSPATATHPIPTATGFFVGAGVEGEFNYNSSGASGTPQTFIYIAIRRGPMKLPTSGTSVFGLSARTGTGANATVTGGQTDDAVLVKNRGSAVASLFSSRLTGTKYLVTSSTSAEATAGATILQASPWDVMDGVKVGTTSTITNASASTFINYLFKRAPSFFDVVCYTGTGIYSPPNAVSHNLGVTPELIIVRTRLSGSWMVYNATIGAGSVLYLNFTNATVTGASQWGNTSPTSTVFYVGSSETNDTGAFVAYLFATRSNVSKVGSYTGTGTTLQINCGFAAGSRFVMIKRTDSTSDWYVWDSARGIIAGNDPYLLLNSSAAEVTGTDYVDTYDAGFELSSTAPAAINASGGTYIFLAIA